MMNNLTPPVLSLRDLRFGYDPQTEVLQGLNLDVAAGEITAILGPNGSGKTTLLQLFLGRLAPDSGHVEVNGKPMADYPHRDLSRQIGLVAQEEQVPFEFTVLEYVVLGRAPYLGWLEMPSTEDYERAAAAIEQVGIRDLQARPVPSLSGGERQLVRFARVLAQDPAIFLLDEPTNHLDLSNRGQILSILRMLAQQEAAVVFTTHDPAAAAAVAHQSILLQDGHVLAAGPVAQIFTDENLSKLYETPLRVRRFEGELVILTGG